MFSGKVLYCILFLNVVQLEVVDILKVKPKGTFLLLPINSRLTILVEAIYCISTTKISFIILSLFPMSVFEFKWNVKSKYMNIIVQNYVYYYL